MQKFTADTFFRIARYLVTMRGALKQASPQQPMTELLKDGGSMHKTLKAIKVRCDNIGLRISKKCVDAILRNEPPATSESLFQGLSQLEQTILWEMEDKLFMFIPPDRAAFHDQQELFGKEVNTKFPSIQFDLVEAGNCYASGRGTATVFHLMRIMEVGVQEFGKTLNVALVNEKNWQNILNEINKAIAALNPKDPKTIAMSEATANLYAVKLAWRNEVMHPKDTYTTEEAANLIRQVKLFMENLARII